MVYWNRSGNNDDMLLFRQRFGRGGLSGLFLVTASPMCHEHNSYLCGNGGKASDNGDNKDIQMFGSFRRQMGHRVVVKTRGTCLFHFTYVWLGSADETQIQTMCCKWKDNLLKAAAPLPEPGVREWMWAAVARWNDRFVYYRTWGWRGDVSEGWTRPSPGDSQREARATTAWMLIGEMTWTVSQHFLTVLCCIHSICIFILKVSLQPFLFLL